MRLGNKTRAVLEIISMIGSDLASGTIRLPTLYKGYSAANDSDWIARIEELIKQGWLRREETAGKDNWVARLSDEAADKISDSIDPEKAWDAPWDGKWRIFGFDLPQASNKDRQSLRRWLQKRRFGRLQGSLWISHREIEGWSDQLASAGIDPRNAISVCGDISGNLDLEMIVSRSWDLQEINLRYQQYLAFLDSEQLDLANPLDWIEREQASWRAAFDVDPFLPQSLWPKGFGGQYLGPTAWARRKALYRKLASGGA